MAAVGSARVGSADDGTAVLKILRTVLDYELVFAENERIIIDKFWNQAKVYKVLDNTLLDAIFDVHYEFQYLTVENQALLKSCLLPTISAQERAQQLHKLFSGNITDVYLKYLATCLVRDRVFSRVMGNDRFAAFVTAVEREVRTPIDKLINHPLQQLTFYIESIKRLAATGALPLDAELNQAWQALNRHKEQLNELRQEERRMAEFELSFSTAKLPFTAPDTAESAQLHPLREFHELMMRYASSCALIKMAECLHAGIVRRRHFFLFETHLLISKPTSHSHKLKLVIDLSYAWINPTPSLPESIEANAAFLLGDPKHRGFVCVCENASDREHWLQHLQKAMVTMKSRCEPEEMVSVCPLIPAIVPDIQRSDVTIKSLSLPYLTTTRDVVAAVLESCELDARNPEDFVLFERSSRGFKQIQDDNVPAKLQVTLRAAIPRALQRRRTSLSLDPSQSYAGSPPLAGPLSTSPTTTGIPLGKHKSKRGIKLLRKIVPSRNRSRTSSSEATESSIDTSELGLFYGRPLDDLVEDGRLPTALEDMLGRLYFHGSRTPELFRKSANGRVVQLIREKLDTGEEVEMGDIPPLILGAALKEFLRNIPDCLLPQRLYPELATSNGISDTRRRVAAVRTALANLSGARFYLFKCMCRLLLQVARYSESNHMTASNLAICVGPSILWPPRPEDVLKNDVPKLIEFVLDHFVEVFPDTEVPIFDSEVYRQRFDLPRADSSDDEELQLGEDYV
ncbi:uncharacterized protein MONBRDRAFT_24989 [Monosiga brevicollis MX1]|uniref:Rho-GAP domain-containing protein n=1 Tax=Monosiga brevicollis TaxID=81824 RepID=A9UXG0_MONBE|nr:uncharacterized protein MONBRDRAFT_24989 [Monosiga brevicollis MX1]EDQ89999.1 predicted protein [Monosiga brevicollis MX1]|eukprot:XP_001745421.1 hypothetical protein [Monosiga brevicollis MX1]